MTKRFILIDGIKKGTHSGIWDKQKQNNQRIGDELWIGEVVSMLNEGVMISEETEQLKSENEELKKRDNLVLGYLTDEGIITFEKYNEIVDYLYKKWQKRNGDVE